MALNAQSEYVQATRDCRNGGYYCPACRSPVSLRSGPKTIPHFAHRKDHACTATSEPESFHHLSGKLQLYQLFQKQVKEIMLEHYFPGIRQKADLFFRYASQSYAIEFQCSPIPLDVFRRRTEGYHRLGIVPIWLFDDNLLVEKGAMQFKISSLLQWGIRSPGMLAFYRPQTKKLRLLTQLTPYTKNTFFGNESIFTEVNFHIDTLLSSITQEPLFLFEWHEKRTFHLLHSIRYEGLRVPFYRRLYTSGYAMHTLPAFVGVPLLNGYLIHTPVVEWQGDLFLELVKRERVNRADLLKIWVEMKRKKQVVLRLLPSLDKLDYLGVLWTYVRLLERVGFLQKRSSGDYLVCKQVLEDIAEDAIVRILNGK